MLEAGARDDPAEPPREWRGLPMPKGLLIRPGLWYRGFRRVLAGLRRSFDDRRHLTPTACPLAVAEMFDKTATARRLQRAQVPVPEMLGFEPPDFVTTRGAAVAANWRTAYVKPNTGSSAMGVVVLHPFSDEPYGITTLAAIDGAFYNSRRLRRVTGTDLDRAVQFVLDEGAIVQRGIPMAQLDGQNFDLRVVCVYGTPAATIVRLSSQPMTNLHLGGRRGDLARCRTAVPTRAWLDALDHCTDAAACFDSAVAGVDVVFERGYGRHYVLEVNAFGDFFPGWVDAAGRSVHSREIEATASRVG
jgi:glutathione synthase/RimK-type ligase-like ATP-grasp enzyme